MSKNKLSVLSDKQYVQDTEILIVDDNPNNLKLLRTLIFEEGYKVRLATSGQMAINSCLSSPPNLILLDISMPGMDGFEVCQAIKNNKSTCSVPIIFLSALKDEFDIVRGYSLGGVDFVTKPFKSEVLKARIATHLTISKLQNNLKDINENLEQIVDKRTRELKKTNKSLNKEIKRHVRTQEKLRESEELYRLTIANLDDTIILISNQKYRKNRAI